MWCGRPAADQPQDGARLPGAAAGPHGRRRAAGTDCGWRGLLLDSAECPDCALTVCRPPEGESSPAPTAATAVSDGGQ